MDDCRSRAHSETSFSALSMSGPGSGGAGRTGSGSSRSTWRRRGAPTRWERGAAAESASAWRSWLIGTRTMASGSPSGRPRAADRQRCPLVANPMKSVLADELACRQSPSASAARMSRVLAQFFKVDLHVCRARRNREILCPLATHLVRSGEMCVPRVHNPPLASIPVCGGAFDDEAPVARDVACQSDDGTTDYVAVPEHT